MTWATADWREQRRYFILHNSYGRPILGTLVRVEGSDETGRGGVSNFLRFVLEKAWVPTGRKEPPNYFTGPHDLIDRLPAFLEVYRHYSGVKEPDPRFQFMDARGQKGFA